MHGLHVRISITRIRSVLRESEWLSYVFSRFDTEHESDRRKDGQNYDSKCHALQQRRAVKTVEQEKLKKGRTAHEISRIHFHITLATFSGKRNVMAWRPSVRLSVPSAYSPWLTRGQNATQPVYIMARQSCAGIKQRWSNVRMAENYEKVNDWHVMDTDYDELKLEQCFFLSTSFSCRVKKTLISQTVFVCWRNMSVRCVTNRQ